jgi:hypothetical protein
MKLIKIFAILTIFTNGLLAQGYLMLPGTPEIPIGDFTPLPQNYVHPNTVTRIFILQLKLLFYCKC